MMNRKRRRVRDDSTPSGDTTLTTRKPSIVVVDDASDGREMLAEYLAFRGFEVAEARDGTEAIEITRRLQPDIVLMDLSMPTMDGWEATRQLKADPLTRHILIIAVTAHAFITEEDAARAAGCDGFISKPFDVVDLADTLSRVARKGVIEAHLSVTPLNQCRGRLFAERANGRSRPPKKSSDAKPLKKRRPRRLK